MTAAVARSRVLPALRRHLLLLSVLLAVLTCPFAPATPGPSLDLSWVFGTQAWVTGSHGDVPVTYFTYGPLGFLTAPVVWARTTYTLALLFVFAIQVALCRVLLARLLRMTALPVAVVGTVLLAALVDTGSAELLVVVVALLAAELVQAGVTHPRIWLVGGAVLAGLVLLVKFSTGVVSLLLLVVVTAALAGPGRRRRLGTAAGATALALLTSATAFGLLTGHPAAFPRWLWASKQIAGGYSGMGYELQGGSTTQDYAFAVPMVLLLLVVAAALALRARALTQLVSATVVALVAYLAFREGFTRHDPVHLATFSTALLLLPLALVLGRRSRWLLLPLLAAALAFGVGQTHTTHPRHSYDLAGNVSRLANRLHLVVDAKATQERGRAMIDQDFQVPRDVQAALRGHRVNVDPWDTSAIWVYGLRWGPSSVWALYSSYTPWLDDHNAASLSASTAPDRILRRSGIGSIDNRNPAFESPSYQLAELCGWRQVVRSGHWQVLERGPDRCAAPTLLGVVKLVPGQPVTVPSPRTAGAVVTVRLQLDTTLRYKLESALFKPSMPRFMTLDGTSRRLVVATAGQPLVLLSPPGLPGLPDLFRPHDTRSITVDVPGTAVFEERDVIP